MSNTAPKTYKLIQALLGWSKGELFTYDPKWQIWRRKKTGEEYHHRSTIGEGEIALLLDYLVKSNRQ